MVFFSSSFLLIPPSIPSSTRQTPDSRFGRLVSQQNRAFNTTGRCRKRSFWHRELPSLPGAVCKPRDHRLRAIMRSLRRHVDIMSVKLDVSLCEGCQRLHDDILQKWTSYPGTAPGRRWNISLIKNADSCGGCSLLVEGVTRTLAKRYLNYSWDVRCHASRISMRYMDTTLVFAGLEGSSSRRQILSFLKL